MKQNISRPRVPTNYGVKIYLKNSLIIHEENTKKNHKRVVSVYVNRFMLIYINFNFDFLGLDNVYF